MWSHLGVSFKGVSKLAVGKGTILISCTGYRVLLESQTLSSQDNLGQDAGENVKEDVRLTSGETAKVE